MPGTSRKTAPTQTAPDTNQRRRSTHTTHADAVGINLDTIGAVEARKIASEEHKVLGFRPPPDSLAAEAQSAATKHPTVAGTDVPLPEKLTEAAKADAARILSERQAGPDGALKSKETTEPPRPISPADLIDLDHVGEAEARILMSAEHKALGYRPPPGSLAAEAQLAAIKHPLPSHNTLASASAKRLSIDKGTLREAAILDAKNIKAAHVSSTTPSPRGSNGSTQTKSVSKANITSRRRSSGSNERPKIHENDHHPNGRRTVSLSPTVSPTSTAMTSPALTITSNSLSPPAFDRADTQDSVEIICNILG